MIRRQATFTDTYSDLPAWVRFGARLMEQDGSGYDTRYHQRTVIHITKTQIVCVEGHDPNRPDAIEIRYRRSNCGRIAPGKSQDGNVLADPNSDRVRNALAVQELTRLYLDIAAVYRSQITQAAREQRPHTEDDVLDRLGHLDRLVEGVRANIAARRTAAEGK